MVHEPGGLLGDADLAPEFMGADPVLVVGDLPDRREPLVEGDGGVLEDRALLDAVLLLTGLALPDPPSLEVAVVLAATLGADGPVRPAQGGDEFRRHVEVTEVLDSFY